VTADPSRPHSVGIVARCLAHRFFWPAYVALVVMGLITLRPWASLRSVQAFGILVHEEPVEGTLYARVGSVLLASESLGPPGSDWLLCDGSRLAKTDFPKLAELIGSRFGEGGANEFRLPDYRGLQCYAKFPSGSLGNSLEAWVNLVPSSPDPDRIAPPALVQSGITFWIKAR